MPFPKILSYLCIIFLSGCSFLDLHKDLKRQDQLVTITGEITATPTTTGPIKVVLIRENSEGRPEVLKYRSQKHQGNYIFIHKPASYRVLAFEDSNRDNRYTVPERVTASDSIDATTPGVRHEINLEIGPRAEEELLAEIAHVQVNGPIKHHRTLLQIGTVTTLDAEYFSMKNAGKGLWQPYKFVQETPFGFFFLEEYDPQKKIVLFVHGVSGTPPQFKSLIDNLDTEHFQPLVIFYPSGFPLGLISQYINNMINELHTTLDFESMSIVAHSMGGLVSRGIINIQSTNPEHVIDCFISISSPWNGHIAASSGLKYAPVVIPVWNDIAPGSEFLETLFNTPLPEETPHYLLFGFKGTSRTAGGNSDGVIAIASQLRPMAQEGARLVRGFDENHVSILSNTEVSNMVNRILAENL